MFKNWRVADLETDRDTAFRRIESLERSIVALSKKFADSQTRAKQLRNGPKSYDKRIAALEKMQASHVAQFAAYDSLLRLWRDRLDRLEERASFLPSFNAAIDALEARLANYEESVGSWRRATEAVGGRLTGHDHAINKLTERADGIAYVLNDTNNRIAALELGESGTDEPYERSDAESCPWPESERVPEDSDEDDPVTIREVGQYETVYLVEYWTNDRRVAEVAAKALREGSF